MPDVMTLAREDPIGRLILNRPSTRNALTGEMWRLIPTLLQQATEDPGIRLLIIEGSGGNFASGADLPEIQALRDDPDAALSYAADMALATRSLAETSLPTIARIEGACVGGGVALALACDLRYADEQARFGVTPAKLGLVYPLGDTARLVQAVGVAAAKDLLFTGRLIAAPEALAMGLIDRVLPVDQLQPALLTYAVDLAALSPQSIAGAKRMIGRVLSGQTIDNGESLAEFPRALAGADFAEGCAAFLAKRPAIFVKR